MKRLLVLSILYTVVLFAEEKAPKHATGSGKSSGPVMGDYWGPEGDFVFTDEEAGQQTKKSRPVDERARTQEDDLEAAKQQRDQDAAMAEASMAGMMEVISAAVGNQTDAQMVNLNTKTGALVDCNNDKIENVDWETARNAQGMKFTNPIAALQALRNGDIIVRTKTGQKITLQNPEPRAQG